MAFKLLREKRELLSGIKKQIDQHIEEWEQIKRDINPLEFVYTFTKGESVSKITPVSRAFFKMIELLEIANDIPLRPIRTLHIAESPGGFIQAINWKRRVLGIIDYNMGWTLRKENAWRKLEDASKTWHTKPVLKIADLLKEDDRRLIIQSHKNKKAFFVTGDGGFDFSSDYEHQETTALPLIIAQCIVGLECLEKDGIFVLKIFDCFTLPTIQILWVFWKVFKGFRVVKPSTSRACNSEKYVVARGFKGISDNLREFLTTCERILKNKERGSEDFHIQTLFEEGKAAKWDTMEDVFKHNFTKTIGDLIDTQYNWIQRGLNKYKIPGVEKIRLAKEWCRKHRIPISHNYYELHPMNGTLAKTDWQENHQHFSLRRRLTSDSPPLCD